MPDNSELKLEIKGDTKGIDDALDALQKKSELFGRTLTNSLKAAAIGGQDLGDVLKQLALNIASMSLSAGLKPLQDLASGLFSSFVGGLKREPGAFYGTSPIPAERPTFFAKGGIVSSPTYFNADGSLGLMGEAGTEAVMPLTRGADGRLGVAAQGGGAPVQVVFNVSTPDATSFRKSEAQLTGMLARAARKGARTF
ncbi:phage tail tape measure protein [Phyllobacterium endophyticum]|uniref:Phage tail protein n=1 Tax=Phyllobacterium endophyticum TaxID=1149773 RepID=A0A2P7B255_9HYPH|nr:phage tail tape measure protein [Phyllobacterium endophyticum]MBB3238130.1 phage-related minor tail protein [Phyllobacterium endophyticum]PSH60534.1 phage tail protein [Phyllobacterium endophyticum]TYR42709.1 phage tail tape measure protein [Phyllobacterium endophyticum]